MRGQVKQTFVGALLMAALVACASQGGGTATRAASAGNGPKAVQVSTDGQFATLQMSRDPKSAYALQPSETALKARDALAARKDLTVMLMNSVAELSVMAGRLDEAAEQARFLLKSDLKNIEALKTLIKVNILKNRFQEALLIADNGMALQPRNADLLCLKGLAHYNMGEVLEAKSAWKLAIDANPMHIPTLMNLGALYFYNRNLSLAGAQFEKVLALQPQHQDAKVGNALVLSALGAVEQSRAMLVEVHGQNPRNGLVLYNLAIVDKERRQDYESALGWVEKYLSLSQSDRAGVEKAVTEREQLKLLIAKKNRKLSDGELRELAARTSQSLQNQQQQQPDAQKPVASAQTGPLAPTPVPGSAKAKNSGTAPAGQVPSGTAAQDDAAALEEQLK